MSGRIRPVATLRAMTANGATKLAALVGALVIVGSLSASRTQPFDVPYTNFSYNGKFTFVRVKFNPTRYGFGPYQWGLDLKWNHDYPQGERNLMTILDQFTTIKPNLGGGNIIGLDEPDLFLYPWAYLCEVGYWSPTDEEVENLRSYLLKGGFLVIDDFIEDPRWGGPWQLENFKAQMKRVLPGYTLHPMEVSHPVFDAFFHIATLDFEHPTFPGLRPIYYGIFEDDDPTKRLLVIVNFNHDIGDYWEWSGAGWVPIDISNEAFKLGVNYVVYGITH